MLDSIGVPASKLTDGATATNEPGAVYYSCGTQTAERRPPLAADSDAWLLRRRSRPHRTEANGTMLAIVAALAATAAAAEELPADGVVTPTAAQLRWMEDDLGAIGHFNMGTFEGCGIGLQ